MSYDLNTCNNLPPSSSSSCSGIFYPGNTSTCRCSSCCQCRGHSCPDNDNLISDHTYTLLKKICRKILRDYTRQQRRESYTLFEGGNSVNVRVHRRASSDRRRNMRIPDLSESRRRRGRCGRDEDYDEDNNVFDYGGVGGRNDRRTQSIDQEHGSKRDGRDKQKTGKELNEEDARKQKKRVQNEPQKDRVLKVGNVKENEMRKRGSVEKQVKGDGKDQDDSRRKQTVRGNKGKQDTNEQGDSPQKSNGTKKDRGKKAKDDNSEQPASSSKSNGPQRGGEKKGKNDVVEQGEKEKKRTKGKNDSSEQTEGPRKSNDTQKERETQTKNNKDAREGNRGNQTKDDANKGKDDGRGKQGKDDDIDASKTKGGKQGKDDSVDADKTKNDKKTKGGKQGNDANVDADKTKNDNNDANKTKAGKQGKGDNDANKTKGGKDGGVDASKTKIDNDASKNTGGKQGKGDIADANRTKDDNNDASKTKGGKQGKDDSSNITSKKKQDELRKDPGKNVREEDLRDRRKSDNSSNNNQKPDKDNDAGVGGNKRNKSDISEEKSKKPPIKKTTTEVNKPNSRPDGSSVDDYDESSKRGHSKGRKEDGNKSRGKMPIVNNLRDKVRNGRDAVPSPKNTDRTRAQSHKVIRSSMQKSTKSRGFDGTIRKQIANAFNREPTKFRPNTQGAHGLTKSSKNRVNIQCRQSRTSQGLISSNENDQRLRQSRCTRPTRWDEAKPHDYLRASMEQRDCMRQCQPNYGPCTPRSAACNYSGCGCMNTCNATSGLCCF